MTTKEEISEWFDNGVKQGFEFMLVACDTFDWSDYPVYCTLSKYNETYSQIISGGMQKLMEVYDLKENKKEQLDEYRCWRLPKSS